MKTQYDYARQAWIVSGIVAKCGRHGNKQAGCYACAHAGERVADCAIATCAKCGHVTNISAGPAFDALKWSCPVCGAGVTGATDNLNAGQ